MQQIEIRINTVKLHSGTYVRPRIIMNSNIVTNCTNIQINGHDFLYFGNMLPRDIVFLCNGYLNMNSMLIFLNLSNLVNTIIDQVTYNGTDKN